VGLYKLCEHKGRARDRCPQPWWARFRRSTQDIHELPDWPKFHWEQDRVASILAGVRHQQGRLLGRMEALGFPLQQEATLQALTEETLKSSEIEGEQLDAEQVRSSIARRLGMDVGSVDASTAALKASSK
jgi:Fic family protein